MVNCNINNGTIEFAYFRPGAASVMLAGDFNNWQPNNLVMENDGNGWWKFNMTLKPGEYRFKYVIDGTIWEADFAAYGVEMSKIGGWTSVLYVDEPQQIQTEPQTIRIAA